MFVVVLAAAAAAAPTVDAIGATSWFLPVFIATGPAMVFIARCAGSDFILQVQAPLMMVVDGGGW